VLSGNADSKKSIQAMEAAYQHLVLHEEKLVLLFEPPFHESKQEPGYVKSYPPGVRENGGHYTHAASWLAAAFAELQNGNRAFEIFQYLNPIHHSSSREESTLYRVEPFAVSADIYSNPAPAGMGGWSWYTGSAAWTYRVGIEWILGFRLRGDSFTLQPCIPKTWKNFRITFRHRSGTYHIQAQNPNGKSTGITILEMDGMRLSGNQIPLTSSGEEHFVKLIL
jgi:cyclic beta-1,2-glucan synthetase